VGGKTTRVIDVTSMAMNVSRENAYPSLSMVVTPADSVMVSGSDIPVWWLAFVHNNAVRSRIIRRTSQMARWIAAEKAEIIRVHMLVTNSGIAVPSMPCAQRP